MRVELLALCLVGCGATDRAPPTFHRDVEPIFQTSCQGCHFRGGIAPFALDNYDDARTHGHLIAAAVDARTMPPWPPSDKGAPLAHSRALTAQQIATVLAWVGGGMAEGALADHGERSSEDPSIRSDLVVGMPAPYSPMVEQGDEYRCFPLDPKLAADLFITGYRVHPGQPSMVHHVTLYEVADHDDALAQLQALDDADPAPGYACTGGPGITAAPGAPPPARVIGGWEPGRGASRMPAGTGLRLEARARIVMEMHYTTFDNSRVPDLTTVAFELEDRVDQEATVWRVQQEKFVVPASAVGYLVTDDAPVGDQQSTLYSVFPHMHLFGTSITVSVVHPSGEDVLIDIPRWQFHWQGEYTLVTPMHLAPNDVIHLRCQYDNSAAHQPALAGASGTPRDVPFGEGTLDEMCTAYLYGTKGEAKASRQH